MPRKYTRELADERILPGMRVYAGDKLTVAEIRGEARPCRASDATIEEALAYLVAGSEVISFPATPEKPKRWTAIIQDWR